MISLNLALLFQTSNVFATLIDYDRDTLKKMLLALNNDPYYEKEFKNCFTPSNVERYLDVLLFLQKQGIELDKYLLELLVRAKSDSPAFISGLVRLYKAGINAGDLFRNEIGAKDNESNMDAAVFKKISSKDYLDNLLELKKQGVSVDRYFTKALTLEKGLDKNLIKNLIKLEKNVAIGAYSYAALSLLDALDGWLVDFIIALKKEGIEISHFDMNSLSNGVERGIIDREQCEKFLEGLIFLKGKGLAIRDFMFPLSRIYGFDCKEFKKIADAEYRQALVYLRNNGVWITDKLIDDLSEEKAGNQAYLGVIVRLSKEGVIVRKESLLEKVNQNPFSFAFAKEYSSCVPILNLIGESHGIIGDLEIEKSLNGKYVSNLISFHKNGIPPTAGLLKGLILEKGANDRYVETIIRLVNVIFEGKVNDRWYLAKSLIENLSIEKALNQEFVSICEEMWPGFGKEDEIYLLRKKPANKELVGALFRWKRGWDWTPSVWEIIEKTAWKSDDETIKILNELSLWLIAETDPVSREIILKNLETAMEQPVRRMNDLHERPDSERIRVIKNASAATLYYMTAMTREIYTSTLVLISVRLREELTKGKTDLFDLVNLADPKMAHFSRFVYALARHERLAYLMEGMPKEKINNFFSLLITQFAGQDDKLEHAFYLGAGIGSLLKNPEQADLLMDNLLGWEKQFRLGGKKDEAILLGIIISVYADYFNADYRKTADKFREIYKISSDEFIDPSRLIDRNGIFHKAVYFYDDNDGRTSFVHFLNQRKTTGWKMENLENLVILKKSTPNSKSAVKEIRIYAVKPIANAKEKLSKYFGEKGIKPKSVVHRGHSYHTDLTLSALSGEEMMVFLGSCGGFQETGRILGKNIETMIFTTSNAGVMTVNDPLLDHIDHALLEGETNLRTIWNKALKKISSKEKNGYIPPYENIGLKIYRSFKLYDGKSVPIHLDDEAGTRASSLPR